MPKDTRQHQIHQAALCLFARYGYKKTTVEDVAAAVGMTKSNIYFYFTSKKDLYEKTVGYALVKWRDSVTEAIDATEDVIQKFTAMADTSFAYISQHEELRAILATDAGIFTLSPSEDRFLEINTSARKLVSDILRQGIDEGRFYPVDVDATTEFIFSVYVMFLIREYVKPEGRLIERMFAEGLALILRGLCTTG